MPQGSKKKYTSKQKRQAEHIAESYGGGKKGKARAWATVNKMTGGGKKSDSGRGKKVNKGPAKKGGRKGGKETARRGGGARKTTSKK